METVFLFIVLFIWFVGLGGFLVIFNPTDILNPGGLLYLSNHFNCFL